MRKLTRNTQPDCLAQNEQVWTSDFVTNRQQYPKYKFRWRSQPCYQNMRSQLVQMTQYHCAFCDGFIGAESRETIEHFQPKSQFPQLAYQWDNLFPCCDVCQSNKGEKFNALLLKPDELTYQFEAYFIANYHTGELEASPSASTTDQERAKITIDLYGLNCNARKVARKREAEKYFKRTASDDYDLNDFPYRYFLD